jgi:transcriptional regulator with XRE-family HTH domain
MSKRPPNKRLRQLVAEAFRKAIEENNLSKTEAAKALGISRQALYGYLNGKSLPGAQILAKAFEHWNMAFREDGLSIDKDAFALQKRAQSRKETQGELFRALAEITPNEIVETKLIRSPGKTVEFRIKIRVAS